MEYYSRRTLLHTPFSGHPAGPSSSSHLAGATPEDGGGSAPSGNTTFDANVVMILAVLLCALICALGINSIVRCALRCSSSSSSSRRAAALAAGQPPNPVAVAQGGLRRKALRAMPVLLYSPGLKLSAAAPMCAVCLCDFEAGEHVRVLPKCNHGFHVRCIDRWLLARSTCPTCRQSLFGAPHRASGCSDSDHHHHHQAMIGSEAAPSPGGAALVPLRREGLAVSTPYDF